MLEETVRTDARTYIVAGGGKECATSAWGWWALLTSVRARALTTWGVESPVPAVGQVLAGRRRDVRGVSVSE